MCGVKDIIQSGWQDLKAHRKNNIVSLILIFMSLVTYIGVSSHADSIKKNIDMRLEFLEGRLLVGTVMADKAEESVALLESIYGDDEKIREISICTLGSYFTWHEVEDILYTESERIMVMGCYEAVLDYDYKGEKKVPDEDEIILPRYLYEIGIYDTKNMGNADSLIGQTIKMSYETPKETYGKDFEFKVIGTYDNLQARSFDCTCYVNHKVAVDMKDLMMDEEEYYEEEIKQTLSEVAGEEVDYEVTRDYCIGIYVAEGYDREEVLRDVEEKTEGKMMFSEYKLTDPAVEGYYDYIKQIGNIISVMLLVISVINITISSMNEVKTRKWEMALKMAMGYEQRDIIMIFFVEKLTNMIKAMILSLFVVALYCVGATYISNNYLDYWMRKYVYTINFENVVVALVLVIIAGTIGMLAGRIYIRNINVSEALKTEE